MDKHHHQFLLIAMSIGLTVFIGPIWALGVMYLTIKLNLFGEAKTC